MILIVTIQDDVHALCVRQHLSEQGYSECVILESDRLSAEHQVHWSTDKYQESGFLEIDGLGRINVEDLDLVWWRRVRSDQRLDAELSDGYQRELINNDCRGALNGALTSTFRGKWISLPDATLRASDKIYQLSVAKKCGFRVPNTLISQSKTEVDEFIARHNGNVIVKPVVGAVGPLIYTQFLKDTATLSNDSFQRCPAVYQEFISGTQHIRLNCFGNSCYAAIIETEELDWRPNLNVPISTWNVDQSLQTKIRNVLDALELEMGIFDFKLTPEGELVWLEVNPQGQFLFLEPLTKMPLGKYFANYLLQMLTD